MVTEIKMLQFFSQDYASIFHLPHTGEPSEFSASLLLQRCPGIAIIISMELKGGCGPFPIEQEMPQHIQMSHLDPTSRFPLSLSASELRILKMGLAALSASAVPAGSSPASLPHKCSSRSDEIECLSHKLSAAEAALQKTPASPHTLDDSIYSAEDLCQIQKVLSVFADYLSAQNSLCLFWSCDGLICLGIDSGCGLYDQERYYVRLVGNGEELCVEILRHLAQEVLERENLLGERYTYYHEATDPVSKAAVAEVARPYLDKLPEYPDVLPKIYRDLY
mgnify:CR=1 FL=1